jgi:hypothetical protein
MSWRERITDGFSYPVSIESKKRKLTDHKPLVLVEAPFEPGNKRKGLLEQREGGRTVLSVPEGGGTFATYEAEDVRPDDEYLLLFDGSRFFLRRVTREVRAKRELKEEGEEEEIDEDMMDSSFFDDGEFEFPEEVAALGDDEALDGVNFE